MKILFIQSKLDALEARAALCGADPWLAKRPQTQSCEDPAQVYYQAEAGFGIWQGP
jgi:hypothetical protein